MSQHDFVIANQGFPNFRSDLNNGLQALASVSAGASEPGTIYAYQLWLDTSTTPNTLKQRNGDNDAWITILYIDQTNDNVEFPAIESRLEDATNNNVSYPLNIIHETSGTPAAGIGTGIKLTTETAAGNNETGAIIEAVVTDASSGAEDFDLVFKTMSGGSTASERMRIDSNGNVGIGVTPAAGQKLVVRGNATGATASNFIFSAPTIQTDVTSTYNGFSSFPSTVDNTFTLTALRHFAAAQGTIGASSTVTSQYGFHVSSSLVNATNNYGFYSDIASGTGRWNLYMNGTANNYMGGSLGIGTTSLTARTVHIAKNMTGGTSVYGLESDGTIQSDATSSATYFSSSARTAASAFTIATLRHYRAEQNALGAGSSITNQFGFLVESNLTSATNNYAFYGNIASGSGRWNLYMNGTAQNYLAAGVNIGGTGDGAWIDDSSHGSTSTTMYIGNQSINTTSDYRLKTNIVNTEANALDVINNLRVVDFEWDDPTDTSWNNKNARGKWTGLIAQEAINHIPYVVNAPRNKETMEPIPEYKDCHGNNVYWFIEYQHMVPMLVKAIQELTDRLNALESQN